MACPDLRKRNVAKMNYVHVLEIYTLTTHLILKSVAHSEDFTAHNLSTPRLNCLTKVLTGKKAVFQGDSYGKSMRPALAVVSANTFFLLMHIRSWHLTARCQPGARTCLLNDALLC